MTALKRESVAYSEFVKNDTAFWLGVLSTWEPMWSEEYSAAECVSAMCKVITNRLCEVPDFMDL